MNRGADALVSALCAAGVPRLFTLSGNHIMSVFDATLGRGIELLHTRHEASAVHMADAWARLSGQPGVALVTGGPGHANAVSALYTARMAESPVVLLSGHAPRQQLGMGAFQEMDQAALAAPVCKAAWTVARAEDLASDFARAWRIARSGRPGPVNLNLPSDLLEAAAPAQVPGTEAFEPQPQLLSLDAARGMLQALRAARRPLILAGPALLTRRMRAQLAALEAACGVPVVGMESPRGIADPSLGAFAQELAQADCILLLGKRLDFTLRFGQAPSLHAQAQVMQVDADADELERSARALGARLGPRALADPGAALETLRALAAAERPPVEPSAAHLTWLAQVRDALAHRPAEWDVAAAARPDRLHPVQMLRPLQALLDSHPDSVLVADGGEIGQWAAACLSAPHRVINGVAGSIGSSLPYALAARRAVPQAPVVAVMGDGTVGFHISELETAVRESLPFVAVVGNDARWNAEHQIQMREYGASRLVGCDLSAADYDAVARAFGAWGERVDSPDQMAPAAARALDSSQPALLNVLIEGVAAPTIRR